MKLLIGLAAGQSTSRTGWTRASGNPILSPAATWEQTSVEEPNVIYESGTWKMWYTGGWSNPAVGYATCTSDPTVAANWTKYAGNPVLGQGGSSVAGWASGTSVQKFGSTYYAYYYTANGGGNCNCSTSTDGITWNTPTTILTAGTPAWCDKYAADLYVWGSSGAWKMLVAISGNASGGQPWQTAYATSSNTTPDSGWTVQGTGPVTSLLPPGVSTTASVYGSIDMAGGQQIRGNYHSWFHAGNGNLSDIYHAYSSDGQTWTITGNIELAHNGGTYEAQQAADPAVVEVNGVTYMFYGGVNNGTSTGYINVATYPSTIADLSLWEI